MAQQMTDKEVQRRRRRAEYMRAWNKQNPERTRAIALRNYRKSRTKNPEKARMESTAASRRRRRDPRVREQDRKNSQRWYRENRDGIEAYRPKSREANRRWRDRNPDKVRAAAKQRRARKAGAPGVGVPSTVWRQILVLHNHQCAYCGSIENITQDHMIPLCRGGEHSPENIVPACNSCNARKNARTPLEWFWAA